MGIVFGIVVAIGTLLLTALFVFGNMMSDAPTERGPPVWPGLIIGGLISATLIFTHFHPISLSW